MGESTTAEAADAFVGRLLAWWEDNGRDFPWRRTNSPYFICIAEIMLHQTVAKRAAPVYESIIAKYPGVAQMSRARKKTLEKMIYTLGFLYRAGRLKELAKVVCKQFGGNMPVGKGDLISLPGVGEYTASAVMCFAYGDQVPIIDANVVRVYSRYFGIERKSPSSPPTNRLKELAAKILPQGRAREYNYAVLDFAALHCKHYSPICSSCPVNKHCKLHSD